MRDDFSASIKETLAKRVGYRCSNPHCRKMTSGPHSDDNKSVNIGVAAHIKAAAPGGKRYDSTMSSVERSGILNGIWLCQSCSKLIDSDEESFPVEEIESWKSDSEEFARNEISTLKLKAKPLSQDLFLRYFVCTSPSVTNRILRGSLLDFPFPKPLLVKNEVHSFWHLPFGNLDNQPYWPSNQTFQSVEEYLSYFPDTKIGESIGFQEYFSETYRLPTEKEISDFFAPNFPFHTRLLEEGVPLEDLFYIYTYQNFCAGDGEYCEQYFVRGLWSVFFSIENISDSCKKVEGLQCKIPDPPKIVYENLILANSNQLSYKLPGSGIQKGETIIFPMATLLEPISFQGLKEESGYHFPAISERVTAIDAYSLARELHSYPAIGPIYLPQFLEIESQRLKAHKFEPDNLFTISHEWMCGSCPFLFFVQPFSRTPVFSREILVSGKGIDVMEEIEIPENSNRLILAELKDEITFIKTIYIDNIPVSADFSMGKGEYRIINIPLGSRILRIIGQYSLLCPNEAPIDPYLTLKTVYNFQKQLACHL